MDLIHPKNLFQNRDRTQFPHACVLISLLPRVAEIIAQQGMLKIDNTHKIQMASLISENIYSLLVDEASLNSKSMSSLISGICPV